MWAPAAPSNFPVPMPSNLLKFAGGGLGLPTVGSQLQYANLRVSSRWKRWWLPLASTQFISRLLLVLELLASDPQWISKPCVTRPELSNCAESTEALWNTLPPPVILPGNQAKQTSPDNRTSGPVVLSTDQIFFI